MLICPECQSENSEENNYCQNCGTSLTHTNCDNCGAKISFVSLECDYCQTPSGRELNALIVFNDRATPKLELAHKLAVNSSKQKFSGKIAKTKNKSWQINQEYLDPQQRYSISLESEQKIISIYPATSQALIINTQAIDKYPLKKSYLNSLKESQEAFFTKLEAKSIDSEALSSLSLQSKNIGLPTIALPYLVLQKYTPVVPPIHDVWQNEFETLLLSDRSSWQLLTNLWSDEETPTEQILWSLNEILKYWTPLATLGCASTLLVEDNLRVDEDHFLGFRQLYFDSSESIPKLKDLANKWHQWLSASPQKYDSQLKQILQKAIAQKIATIDHLRTAIQSLVIPEDERQDSVEEISDTYNFSTDETDDSSLFEIDDLSDQPTNSLRMEIASVSDASGTDVGFKREHNEDFFSSKTIVTQTKRPNEKTISAQGLYLVCDGMGGHSAGEVASSMAVEILENYFDTYWQDEFPDEEIIKDGILLANHTIYQTNVENKSYGKGMMGTTLVMALLQNTQLAIANVGDSRIYRVTRTIGLEQLTQDHEVGQREINRGVEPEIAYNRPDAYQLTQALGPRDNRYVRPAVDFLDIQEDCLLLLCSDGLCDNELLEKHWQTYLQPLIKSNADIESGLVKLIDFANSYNGHDNITAVLLRVKLQPNFEA